ncbi:TetR/AcrR family transcriptional regulator [Paenibacillus antarcticus]|uniref:Transcriptional regulator n=1 Tax=Paenibacillus antarcticus TaxID=253703 RepID=A0A168PST4_9BACL|nr:TetR/AcrR family transcriptional regulator [Paenibacillus antarcticus]OAB47038.1 transcriptional regulator [Paenibacillus antarcticus]
MLTKQELRSQATKKEILTASAQLFATKGFDSVTMREIAKVAGCSHTTIYIYFKDKEALLHQLSMPPLEAIQTQMEHISLQIDLSPEDKLKRISLEFIRFCLLHRNIYSIFMTVKASRVDVEVSDNEVNTMRIALFNLLEQSLQQYLVIEDDDERLIMYTRIYFYTLHGIISLYTGSEESLESIVDRLLPTFEEAIEVLLIGFKEKLKGDV